MVDFQEIGVYAANTMSTSQAFLKQGTTVRVGEFDGTIVRHYHENIYEIRLPGGVVSTSDFIVLNDGAEVAQKPEDLGTTGLITYVLNKGFKGSWQRWLKARSVIQKRHGAEGVRRFALAVFHKAHDGSYSNQFVTRVTSYTGIL